MTDKDGIIAAAAHMANRAYCIGIGDMSQVTWEEAPEWQRASAVSGVRIALAGATPEQQHEAWCADKRKDGWTHGSFKDPILKTHPCLVPYAELPEAQKRKDVIYIDTVLTIAALLMEG